MAITPAYECMLILKPSLAKEESDKIIDRYLQAIGGAELLFSSHSRWR